MRNLSYMPDGSIPLDVAVCRWLALEIGVIAMPVSYFYLDKSPYVCDTHIRFAICKGMDITKEAIEKLQRKA